MNNGAPSVNKTIDGKPLSIAGNVYSRGISIHTSSSIEFITKGNVERFQAEIGMDDISNPNDNGSFSFWVYLDGFVVYDSRLILPGKTAKLIDIDTSKAWKIRLETIHRSGSGFADWANARFILKPKASFMPYATNPYYIPNASPIKISPVPAIHGPRIVGTTPGREFIFLVPATGEKPLSFYADNLPDGLSIDKKTGIISGSVKKAGEYIVSIKVEGPKGIGKRKLKIVAGKDKLALTPPMGWNSWNVWASAIDDKKISEAADAMVNTGLASHGFQYINVDDCWQGIRDENGEITSNKNFPDMKATSDYIHSKGLRFGIYSSPGPLTCEEFEGSYLHEDSDAKTYAKWCCDYLKYD